jgi:hypothetical protein
MKKIKLGPEVRFLVTLFIEMFLHNSIHKAVKIVGIAMKFLFCLWDRRMGYRRRPSAKYPA